MGHLILPLFVVRKTQDHVAQTDWDVLHCHHWCSITQFQALTFWHIRHILIMAHTWHSMMKRPANFFLSNRLGHQILRTSMAALDKRSWPCRMSHTPFSSICTPFGSCMPFVEPVQHFSTYLLPEDTVILWVHPAFPILLMHWSVISCFVSSSSIFGPLKGRSPN